jgi:putative tryptophan/tyrosine transport system substrate-binding protein
LLLFLLVFWCTLTGAGAFAAEDATVWLALSEAGGPYAEAANVIRDELAGMSQRRVDVRVGTWQSLVAPGGKPPQLIVTIGAAAFRGIVEDGHRGGALDGVPVLATLVPRALYESLSAKTRSPISGVFLDQPLSRFLDLLRLAMPERKHIGVLVGAESAPFVAQLTKAAASRGLQLSTVPVASDEDLYPALRSVLNDADVLLALPDARVYNTGSLQNILITTYRQRVPMVAFAPGYVRAGATLALFSSPSQSGVQTANIVKVFLGGRGLPAPQVAGDFSVAVNDRVARSLGLSIDDGAALAEALKRQEGQR